MSPTAQLANNLRYLRLASDLTQEQAAELLGMGLKFYQSLERGRRPQIKLETVERLGRPFGLTAWLLLAPETILRRQRFKRPIPVTKSPRGPRAKWRGIASGKRS